MLYDPSLFNQNRIPNLSPPSPKIPQPDKATRLLQELLQEMAARVETLTVELTIARQAAEFQSREVDRLHELIADLMESEADSLKSRLEGELRITALTKRLSRIGA